MEWNPVSPCRVRDARLKTSVGNVNRGLHESLRVSDKGRNWRLEKSSHSELKLLNEMQIFTLQIMNRHIIIGVFVFLLF